jgi:hypothetical protein
MSAPFGCTLAKLSEAVDFMCDNGGHCAKFLVLQVLSTGRLSIERVLIKSTQSTKPTDCLKAWVNYLGHYTRKSGPSASAFPVAMIRGWGQAVGGD